MKTYLWDILFRIACWILKHCSPGAPRNRKPASWVGKVYHV